ncbi:MAG: hypothetical protein ACI9TV_001902 [Sulfurimonas sp.]|jgi:hypothetical protein|uniref:hypothetical protein n=1 Tax=Sulfurimonas sp. TaxID=2022749 RepID=UPI0039E4E5D0
MPNKNDSYIITLKKAHIEWGTHRHTETRELIYGEGYIQIPSEYAQKFEIFMSNKKGANIEYKCSSSEGTLSDITLKASGSQGKNNLYAKQFQGSGNLKTIGNWYNAIKAKTGDKIKVTFTSPTTIYLEKL